MGGGEERRIERERERERETDCVCACHTLIAHQALNRTNGSPGSNRAKKKTPFPLFAVDQWMDSPIRRRCSAYVVLKSAILRCLSSSLLSLKGRVLILKVKREAGVSIPNPPPFLCSQMIDALDFRHVRSPISFCLPNLTIKIFPPHTLFRKAPNKRGGKGRGKQSSTMLKRAFCICGTRPLNYPVRIIV